MRLTPVILTLLASETRSWVTISQARYGAQVADIRTLYDNTTAPSGKPPQQLLGYLWQTPQDPTSHDGLGGGITWAWDPNLCAQLLPKFEEDFFFVPFVTCSMLKAAMGRGFASWSANSAQLSFTDVSAECEKLGQLNENCPLAEIWVTANNAPAASGGAAQSGLTVDAIGESPESGELALGGTGVSAALALPYPRYQAKFMYTNGVEANTAAVIETTRARVSFNTDLCWYLDVSQFALHSHELFMDWSTHASDALARVSSHSPRFVTPSTR